MEMITPDRLRSLANANKRGGNETVLTAALRSAADRQEQLRFGLNQAAYALFVIESMDSDAIKAHAAEAYANACAALGGYAPAAESGDAS